MNPEEKDLRDWIAANRAHFLEGNYLQEEVAYFARMNGFDDVLVYRVLSHFEDALHGRDTDERLALQMVKLMNGLPDLKRLHDCVKTASRNRLEIKLLKGDK